MRLPSTIVILLTLTSIAAFSQQVDTLYTGSDTLLAVETSDNAKRYDPRKASLYSAVLPGLGQAYNDSYWKIPIVYGGFVALYYVVDRYHDYYTLFRNDLFYILENEGVTAGKTGYSEAQLTRLVERTRRERDFYIIISGVYYLLQIAEAHIDAHLKEFKLNPELRVQIDPQVHYARGLNTGLSIKLKF